MAQSNSKTVRFTQVVERCGEPRVHTLWLPPEKDPEFKRARGANRVMTVETAGATGKTDVGRIGFDPADTKPGQFLIFPKSLQRFEGARVVGIKFDLVAQSKLAPATSRKTTTATRSQKTPQKTTSVTKARKAIRSDIPENSRDQTSPTAPAEALKVVPFESDSAAEDPPPAKAAVSPKSPPPSAPKHRAVPQPGDRILRREIHAAMKELKAGKSVAAYQRLERAVASD